MEAIDELPRHDAYPFFDAFVEVLKKMDTTGTNVNDLVFLCIM